MILDTLAVGGVARLRLTALCTLQLMMSTGAGRSLPEPGPRMSVADWRWSTLVDLSPLGIRLPVFGFAFGQRRSRSSCRSARSLCFVPWVGERRAPQSSTYSRRKIVVYVDPKQLSESGDTNYCSVSHGVSSAVFSSQSTSRRQFTPAAVRTAHPLMAWARRLV